MLGALVENTYPERLAYKFLNELFNLRKNRENLSESEYNTGVKNICLLYTSPSPRDLSTSRMPSSA